MHDLHVHFDGKLVSVKGNSSRSPSNKKSKKLYVQPTVSSADNKSERKPIEKHVPSCTWLSIASTINMLTHAIPRPRMPTPDHSAFSGEQV